jgi:hypothetical protein
MELNVHFHALAALSSRGGEEGGGGGACYTLNTRRGGPQSRCGRFEEHTNHTSYKESNPQLLGRPIRSLVCKPTEQCQNEQLHAQTCIKY